MDLTLDKGLGPAEASAERAKPKGDSMGSQTVASTVSEDNHLEGNRGGESRDHERHDDDKTPRWTNGVTVPITRIQCFNIMLLLTMILFPAAVTIHRNQSKRLAVQPIVNGGQHQNSLESLFGSNTRLGHETWEGKPSAPNHQHAPIQGVGLKTDKGETSHDQSSGGANHAPNKGTLPDSNQMDAYDAEAPHKYENAAEIVEGLRESVGAHRTKAGLWVQNISKDQWVPTPLHVKRWNQWVHTKPRR